MPALPNNPRTAAAPVGMTPPYAPQAKRRPWKRRSVGSRNPAAYALLALLILVVLMGLKFFWELLT